MSGSDSTRSFGDHQPPQTRDHLPTGTADHADDTRTPAPRGVTTESTALIPGYEILGELGRGGMGVVFKARQLKLNRVVALKTISRSDAVARARFLAEAEAVAAVRHLNVVQVFESGEHDGQPYLAMEYLPGGTLTDYLSDGTREPAVLAGLVGKVAAGVAAAHDLGIVHRDLKPGNVLFDEHGEPKVTDFGLAKRGLGTDLTRTQAVMGTPAYMAPEQAKGAKFAGPPADVWALGVILYECLTGTQPFAGDRIEEVLHKVLHDDPPRPRAVNPAVPRDVELICLKCLEKNPADRYASARELADDLRRFLDGRSVLARPMGALEQVVKWARRRPAVAALLTGFVVVTVAGVVGVFWQWRWAEQRAAAEKVMREQAETAQQAEAAAREAEKASRLLARRHRYAAEMNQATRAWNDGHYDLVRETLDAHRPEPGEEDLRGFEWYHLWRQVRADWLTLSGHGRWVRTVSFSPDGRWLATGSYDTTVRVWDADSGREVRCLRGHTSEVHRVVFSPDGRYVASGGNDGVILWDWEARTQVARFESKTSVWAVGFSPDPAHTLLAWADTSGRTRLYDVKDRRVLPDTPRQLESANCLTWLPTRDRKVVVFGYADGIHIWDLEGGQEVRTPVGDSAVLSVAFSSDGSALACGGRNGGVRLIDSRARDSSGWVVAEAGLEHAGAIWGVGFSPDGKTLASGSWYHTVKLWDVTARRELATLKGHAEAVKYVEFAPHDGNRLATASRDGTVKLWDLPVAREQALPRLQLGSGVSRAAISADGTALLAVLADEPPTARLWDLAGRREPNLPVSLRGPITKSSSLALSGDGKTVAVGTAEGLLLLLDLASGQPLASHHCHAGSINFVALASDGRVVVTGNLTEGGVRVWERSGSGLVARPAPPTLLRPDSVALAPDGRTLAVSAAAKDGGDQSGDAPGTVFVWDVARGGELRTLGTTATAPVLAFSPDGKALAVVGVEKQGDRAVGLVELWDASTGHLRFEPRRIHREPVRSAAFSPDGRTLATGDGSGMVKLWDPITGGEKATLESKVGEVVQLAFTADGRKLVARGSETLCLWPAATEAEVFGYTERTAGARDDVRSRIELARGYWGLAERESGDPVRRRQRLESGRDILRALRPQLDPNKSRWLDEFELALQR